MDTIIAAIYEGGVFRPLEPVQLGEAEVVSLSITRQANDESAADKGLRQRDILLAFIKEMESLPDNNPQDGLSNRDHDRIIYGQ